MANVLNLTLKKDIFERLLNRESNEIPIKKSDWWRKRLMDLDTGRFKYFDVAVVSSGSEQKYEFEIDHIEQRDQFFVVVVVFPTSEVEEEDLGDSDSDFDEGEDITPEQINPEVLEPTTVNPVVIDEGEVKTIKQNTFILTDEQKQAIIRKLMNQIEENNKEEQEKPDVKVRVMEVMNDFYKNDDVFVVNMPNVTIRNNGQIIGYLGNKRLHADRDSDVRFDFKKMYIVKYHHMSDDEFVYEVKESLNKLLQGNYAFINKKYCGFSTSETGELVFKIAVVFKKKYLFMYR